MILDSGGSTNSSERFFQNIFQFSLLSAAHVRSQRRLYTKEIRPLLRRKCIHLLAAKLNFGCQRTHCDEASSPHSVSFESGLRSQDERRKLMLLAFCELSPQLYRKLDETSGESLDSY